VAAVELRHLDAETLKVAAVLFDADSLEQAETATTEHSAKHARAFALNFEETLAIVEALRALAIPAGLIVCPGNVPGHPPGLNLATHLGLVTAKATFGVSDAPYTGLYDEPGQQRGDCTDLLDDDGAVIGRALRTREGQETLFVTYGHRLSLEAAVEMTLRLTTRTRLPVVTTAAAAALDEDARVSRPPRLTGNPGDEQ
jgi:deoxyribonuclease V